MDNVGQICIEEIQHEKWDKLMDIHEIMMLIQMENFKIWFYEWQILIEIKIKYEKNMVQYKQEMMFILKTLTISIFMMIIEMFIMEIQIKTEILNFKIMVIMEKILITHQIIFINQCANQELVIQ